MGKLADDFRKGEESAKIKSYGDGIFRAFILATATAAAWVSRFLYGGGCLCSSPLCSLSELFKPVICVHNQHTDGIYEV